MIKNESNAKFLIDGLNRLGKLLDEKRLMKSRILLNYIERKMITALIVAKQEPTKENLDRAYAFHVKKFGGDLLMYRHFANQHMDSIVNKTIDNLRFHEIAINKAREIEFEPSLNKLRGKDPAVNERMIEIGRMIKEARAVIDHTNGDHATKANEKKLNTFVASSDVSEASESLFETVVMAAKAGLTDTATGGLSPSKPMFKPSGMTTGAL